MASVVIHMAIAKEVNKKLNRKEDELLLGTIAPDLGKLVRTGKELTHFIVDRENIPELDIFLDKYKEYLSNDFVLGYYIHLYADYLWFNYFIPEVFDKELITKLDGEKIKCNGRMFCLYIYNDYTNLNHILINKFHLDLDNFINLDELDNPIEEIDKDQIPILIDSTKEILDHAGSEKDFIFTGDHIERFIDFSSKLILSNLKDIL